MYVNLFHDIHLTELNFVYNYNFYVIVKKLKHKIIIKS